MIIGVCVSDFGAVGDGGADDTAAVQAAIDEVHSRGGGRVILAAGHSYRCGSLELKSRVELHLEPGSQLIAATRIEEYSRRFIVGALAGGVSANSDAATAALIWAVDASDVSITGSGVIDGSAHAYVTEPGSHIHRMTNARPFPVFLIGCTRVTITGVRFVDAALWTVRLSGRHVVDISAIRIDNDMRVPNADGIDLDHCTRVRVIGCDIRCPDDGISLKTTDEYLQYGPTEDIVISACTIESLSTAITLGVDADCPIRNVVVTGCVVRNSHRGVSVSVGTGVGGWVANVLVSDLIIETRHADDDWWGSGEPIVVRSAPWHDAAGSIRHVRFSNILARAENGILIYAAPGGVVEDVQLHDIRLELGRWTSFPGHRLDLRPFDDAPTEIAYRPGLLAARPSAVHIEGARDVLLRDLRVRRSAEEFGPVLTIHNSSAVTWAGVATESDERAHRDELVIDGEGQQFRATGAL